MSNNAQTAPTSAALLLTRPRELAFQFLETLDPAALAGVEVVISPLIEIVTLDRPTDTEGAAGAIFTSGQGVARAPNGAGLPAYCVGRRTANAARVAGWDVRLVAETAKDLLAAIPGDVVGPLNHYCGKHRSGTIAEQLTARGLLTHVVVLYDQQLRSLSAEARELLAGPKRVIVPLFSPRTAAQFLVESEGATRIEVVAISDAAADLLRDKISAPVHVARAPDGLEMGRCVEIRLRDTSLP